MRNGVKTASLSAGELAFRYFRFLFAPEVADARTKIEGFGAVLANVTHFMWLSVSQYTETATAWDEAPNEAWFHRACERGSKGTVRDELVELPRNSLDQRAGGIFRGLLLHLPPAGAPQGPPQRRTEKPKRRPLSA